MATALVLRAGNSGPIFRGDADGDVLRYQSATGKWLATTPGFAFSANIGALAANAKGTTVIPFPGLTSARRSIAQFASDSTGIYIVGSICDADELVLIVQNGAAPWAGGLMNITVLVL